MRILITDNVHKSLPAGFLAMGWDVDYEASISPEAVLDRIASYEGVVINSKIRVSASWLERADRLQFIARLGSGLDIIDLEATAAKGVKVYSSPEGNRNAVAEHALGLLLSLSNQLRHCQEQVVSQEWNREACRGTEIMGKTVGIIGFGHNGSSFAQKLSGLGVRVLAHDKYKHRFVEGQYYCQEVDRDQLVREADIISLHIPLTEETHHYVDADFLASVRPGCWLINCCRGGVVDTTALWTALDKGQLGGVGLDVFENEKPSTWTSQEADLYQKLYAHPQVVLSPHVAGWTHESKARIAQVLLEKIRRDFEISEN